MPTRVFKNKKNFYAAISSTVFLLLTVANSYSAQQIPSLTKSETSLTLAEAVAIGIRNNRGIQEAYLQRVAQKFDLYVSEGKFYPKLIVSGTFLNNRQNGTHSNSTNLNAAATLATPTGAALSLVSTNSGGSDISSTTTTEFKIAQPLLKNGGVDANMASVRIARIDEQINRLSLKSSIEQTVVQIIFAYRELLRAQEQKKIADASLKRARELYEVNKLLISTGRMAAMDLIQTEAEVANQAVVVEEANNQIDTTRLALLNLLALEPVTAVIAAREEVAQPQPSNVEKALSIASANHPGYLSSLLFIERANISLDYAKNQRLWDVSLVAGQSHTQGGGSGTSSGSNSSFAGLQVTVPFGDRTLEQGEVQASVALKNQQLISADVHQILEQRVRDAVRNVQTRWRQLELAKTSKALTLQKLNAENEKLKAGRSSNFQVLLFENDLRNSENAQLNAEITYLNALTELDMQTGQTLDVWQIPVVDQNSSHYE